MSMSSKGNNPQAAEKEVARRRGPISQSVVPKLITCQRMGLQRSPAARPRTSRYTAGAKSTRRWGMGHAQRWRYRNFRVENTPEKSRCVSI